MTARIDYQTLITLDTATPIAAGRMKADGSDIRVWNDGYFTEALDFYVEDINSSETKVWVKKDHTTGRYHPNIAHYWPLDFDGYDIINSADGTTYGATYIAGQISGAADFAGATDRIEIPAANIFVHQGLDISYEFWIYPRSLGGGSVGYILEKRGTGFSGFNIRVNALSGGKYSLFFQYDYTTTDSDATTDYIAPENEWSHVVAIHSATTNQWTVYFNGESVTFASETTGVGSQESDSGVDLVIGNRIQQDRNWDGLIDNVAVYRRVLTADEAKSSYLRGLAEKRLSEPVPNARWSFDSIDNAGSEVVDIIGGHNGSIAGGVTPGKKGRVGQAFEFDGSTGYISILDNSEFNPHTGASGTSTWAATIYVDSLSSTNVIFGKLDSGGANREFYFGTQTSGKLRFVANNGTSGQFVVDSTAVIPTQTWTHVACTYDNTLGSSTDTAPKVQFFVDGIPVSDSEVAQVGTHSSIQDTAEDLLIGASDAGSPQNFFDGQISEALWTSDVLSDDNILRLAERSKQGKRPNFNQSFLANTISYWSFDNKDIGTNPQDLIGQNHGTNTNNVLVGQEDSSGEYFTFDGTNYVEIVGSATSSDFQSHTGADGQMTLVAGIRFTAVGPNNQIIMAKYRGSVTNDREFQFRIDNTGELRLLCTDPTGSNSLRVVTDDVLNADTFYHVAAVFDNTASGDDRGKVFVDGEAVAQTVDETGSGFSTMTNSTTEPFGIGAQQFSYTSQDSFFIGDIYSPAYFGEALTDSQVMDLYRKFSESYPPSSEISNIYITYGDPSLSSTASLSNTFVRSVDNLVAAYDFSLTEDGHYFILDDLADGYDASIDGYTLPSTGQFGDAVKLDGNGAFDFTDQVIPIGSASISLRFRTSKEAQILLANYDGDANNRGSSVEMEDGYVVFRNATGAGTDNAYFKGSDYVADNLFHHVVVTKDNSNVVVYVDGTQDGTTSMSSAETLNATANLRIGGYTGSYSAEAVYDELRIYSDVLTSTEIADLADTGFEQINVNQNGILVRKRIEPDPAHVLISTNVVVG